MTPFEALVAMFTADLRHARRIAHDHRLDGDGRCVACHSTSVSSGRSFGCTLGAAAQKAIVDARRGSGSGRG